MPSLIEQFLSTPPRGRLISLVHFAVAGTNVVVVGYAWSVGNVGSLGLLLGIALGAALAGVAESLPEHRRRGVGLLRLVAILVLLGVVGLGVTLGVLRP